MTAEQNAILVEIGKLNASAEAEWKKFFLASGIDPDEAEVLAAKVEALAGGFSTLLVELVAACEARISARGR
jgi:hypothetical protein